MAVNGIDAVYYTVIDLKGMTEFYSAVLGAPPSVSMDRLAEWTFPDNTAFGIYMADGKTGGRSGSAMFAVNDMAAAAQTSRDAGARVDADGEVTETPVCSMMFAYDPEGNQFILHKRKV